jgi:electron transport complex protein RnfB
MGEPVKKVMISRRAFLTSSAGVTALAAAAAVAGLGLRRAATAGDTVWQIDPDKCVQCGRCATSCVLAPSAVKCVHAYDVCGYCNRCGGFHQPTAKVTDTAAENQLCPTSAIRRTFVEDPYYRYDIVESLCIGCGKCVKGCGAFGNGSLFLQIRHDRCVNCNQCAIAQVCPAQAISRVPASRPYKLRGVQGRRRDEQS